MSIVSYYVFSIFCIYFMFANFAIEKANSIEIKKGIERKDYIDNGMYTLEIKSTWHGVKSFLRRVLTPVRRRTMRNHHYLSGHCVIAQYFTSKTRLIIKLAPVDDAQGNISSFNTRCLQWLIYYWCNSMVTTFVTH